MNKQPTCLHCQESFDEQGLEVSLEAFEVLGELVCEFCADECLAENGQFGVGA